MLVWFYVLCLVISLLLWVGVGWRPALLVTVVWVAGMVADVIVWRHPRGRSDIE